jgi:hypothetical protein
MGWLGWTEQQAMQTDVNSIELAMEGKIEMINPELAQENRSRGLAGSKFRAFARDHNLKWGAQHD